MKQRSHWFVIGAIFSSIISSGLFVKPAYGAEITRQLHQQPFGIELPFELQKSDRLLEEGINQSQLGNLAAAITSLKSAAESYRLLNNLEGQQRAYGYLSQAYQRQNRTTELEDALRQQLRFARSRQDFPQLILSYNQVGELLLRTANTAESEKSFAEGLRIAQDIKDIPGQGRSLTNLGLAAIARGDYALAITHLNAAINRQQLTPNVTAEAVAHNALGEAYRNLGDFQKSVGSHLNALILARTGDDYETQDRAMTGLAIAYKNLGANNEAKSWLDARLNATTASRPTHRAHALRAIAEFYERDGDLAAADQYYSSAIVAATQAGESQMAQSLSQKLENIRRSYHLAPRRKG
ncbi:MAG: tetratricopeptide repeat protein [Cyanobacteria bacterium]|nr:tetratricopeptide repeat protein [Cyanobacteriota bacterium]